MASILIAEDIEIQATLIERYLSGTHTVVAVVNTADDAVEAAREVVPDLVVMDLNLREGNGFEATEAIKNFDSDIKILVSTISAKRDVREQAFAVGADEFLTKPYDQAELLATVDDVLE
jgi:CheY-like chemotaxis protein